MKDIDFDELDRAVSSALGGTPEPTAAADTPTGNPVPAVTPVETSSVDAAVAPAVSGNMSEVVAVTPTPAPQVQASPAARRGGRFMDVVHPSSDMKPPSSATPAFRVPKRTFGPVSDDMKVTPTRELVVTPPVIPVKPVDPVGPLPTFDTSSSEPEPVETVDEQPVVPAPMQAWPDPLDLHEANETPEPETVESVEAEPTNQVAEVVQDPVAEESANTSEEDSSQTPFLSDTKVDKRPLGAFAETTSDSVDEPVPNFNPVPSPSQSPEFGADVVAVEATGLATNEQVPDSDVTTPFTAVQPVSITPQYNAEDKASNTDAHSVFDTSSYHQPLLPQKTHGKSHTWIWVLIITGLLIVGAGLGAVFFMAGF